MDMNKLVSSFVKTYSDEGIYEYVANEVEKGIIRKGLWTKAMSETDMDEVKARALYVRLRVKQLKKSNPRLPEIIALSKEKTDKLGESQHNIQIYNERIRQLNNSVMKLNSDLNLVKENYKKLSPARRVMMKYRLVGMISTVVLYYTSIYMFRNVVELDNMIEWLVVVPLSILLVGFIVTEIIRKRIPEQKNLDIQLSELNERKRQIYKNKQYYGNLINKAKEGIIKEEEKAEKERKELEKIQIQIENTMK